MGRRNVHEELHNQNVQPLNNDYVRSNPQARAQIKEKIAVRRRRRLAIFFIFATLVIAGLIKTNMVQSERLAAKEESKAAVTAQLDEAMQRQELLNLQIAKLEDDEYIAKLARKEFFLSEEGEIIFTIPNTSKKGKDEKSEDKEK